ncbi:MAG: GNAT family N-acetyltransferase [Cypionkella sp.]|nr:GNAT family N-acetyltransferase [Cypionkella sp.]
MSVAQTRDITACRALRRAVFIKEQGVSEADEIDDLDDIAVHLLAYISGQAVGSARLLTDGATGKIGRVCVLKEVRGQGVGAALTRAAVDHFRAQGLSQIKLSAQLSAVAFYDSLGFTAHGPVYFDAGIDHRDMMLLLNASA